MGRPPRSLGALAIAAAALILTPPHVARADASASEKKLAKDMLGDAVTAEKAGKCPEALDLLKQVLAIHESAEALLHYGECLSRTGHLLDAATAWERAGELAKKDHDRATEAALPPKLEELRGRTPTVLLQVPAGVTPTVEIDHQPVPQERVAQPIRLDPGDHMIEVKDEAQHMFLKQVKLAEKDAPVVSVVFPADDTPPPAKVEAPRRRRGGIPLGTWMAGGAAVLLTAGGTAAFLGAGSAATAGRDQCAKLVRCDPGDRDLVHQLDGVALGLWLSAGLAAGTAIVIWDMNEPSAPKDKADRAAPTLRARVGPAGVRLEGAF